MALKWGAVIGCLLRSAAVAPLQQTVHNASNAESLFAFAKQTHRIWV